MILVPAGALIGGSPEPEDPPETLNENILGPLGPSTEDGAGWKAFPEDELGPFPVVDIPTDPQGNVLAMQGKRAVHDAQGLAAELERASPAQAVEILTRYADQHELPEPPKSLDPEEALRSSGIDPLLIPADMREPIGKIWSAVLVAEAMQEKATEKLTDEERELLMSGALWGIVPLPDQGPPADDGDTKTIMTATAQKAPVVADSTKHKISQKVDQAALAAAALHLLTTIEETIPLLPEPQPANAPALAPNECDSEPNDLLGLIAFDTGTSTNYSEDYMLSIDLGGNDCYLNNAGGAENGIAVAIDLAGNDHYHRSSNTSAPLVTQGAANIGIGVLVDLGGNDDYFAEVTTVAPEPGPIADPATVIAQGGASVGIGVFADLGGTDTIRSTAWSSGNNATVLAQGGAENGIGVALSGPLGSDTTWEVSAESQRHLIIQEPFYEKFLIGGGDVTGQGGAITGIGVLVDVFGDDTYDFSGIGGRATVVGQGGGLGGIGVLVDVVGGDTYTLSADGFETLDTIVTSSEFCWQAFTITETEDTIVTGQGGAADLGIGILADVRGSGGNTLTSKSMTGAVAHTEVRASADEELCQNRANATSMTGQSLVMTQGAGSAGIGILLGSFEHDFYAARSDALSEATALVLSGRDGVEIANATSKSAHVNGQGYGRTGFGIAVDPLGDDTYTWDASDRAFQRTSAGIVNGSSLGPFLHGEGFALGGLAIGWLLDLGGDDAYGLSVAADSECWTHPEASSTMNLLARGRDWETLNLDICV